MTARDFARLLLPLAALVFIGGWILAAVAFAVIGTETCAEINLGLAGRAEVCQDTSSDAVILLTVIGFSATVGSLFLLSMRFMLLTLADIADNTRKG